MSNKSSADAKSCSRLGTVGGQAVIEGVMMKSKNYVALSVRQTDGKIATWVGIFTSGLRTEGAP